MRQTPAFLLASLVALGSMGALAQSKTTVVIHILSQDTCVVADLHVTCREVGAKLHELRIPTDAEIQFSADGYAGYDTMIGMVHSLDDSGYKIVKVGFITSPR